MRPIPRHLLQHTAVLLDPVSEDTWQNTEYRETTIDRIAVEPSGKWVTDNQNRRVQLTAVLFFDCVNSVPRGVAFTPGQKLRWNGSEYTIITTEQMLVGKRPHHWEVGIA